MFRKEKSDDESATLIDTDYPSPSWGTDVCDTVTHGFSRLWYRIVDPQYRDFLVASRRLRLLDLRLTDVVRVNSGAIARSFEELRKAEDSAKSNMDVFRTKVRFREQQFKHKMKQRGVDNPVFSQQDIESWLSADEIELKFRCIQDMCRVDRIRKEIHLLQTTHACLNTNLNLVRGWGNQLKLGEHARVMSSLLKDIDGVVLKDIAEKFDANLNKLDASLSRLSMFADRDDTVAPQLDSAMEPDVDVVMFWEGVLEHAVDAKVSGRQLRFADSSII